MTHSRTGKAIYIRVNPKNCMGVYDALKLAGLDPADFTFGSAVARVFDMLMDGLRRDRIIPERDGFEFNALMESFIQQNKAQLPSVQYAPTQKNIMPVSGEGMRQTSEQRKATQRFKELAFKKESAPDSWTAEDEEEMDRVYQQMG